MTFGERIKKIRKEKGMSQRLLGEKLGVKQQTVAQYEKIQEIPKYETVQKLADALEVPIHELNRNGWTISATPGKERRKQKPKAVSEEEALVCTTKLLDYAGCNIALTTDEIRRITQITKDLHVSLINDIKGNSDYITVDSHL